MKKQNQCLKNFILSALMIPIGLTFAKAEEVSAVGVFVEPMVLFESTETSINYPTPFSNSTGRVDGFGLGARFGIHLVESVYLALDARYTMPQFKDSSVQYDAKAISTNWGPVLGVQMPVAGLRIWGSSILGGGLNPEKSGGLDVDFQNASGYRIGTGLHISNVSLNIEYQQLKYGKSILEQIGGFNSGTSFNSVSLETKAWILSASFPFEF